MPAKKETKKKTTETKETKKKSVIKENKEKKPKTIIFDLWGTVLENGVYPSPTKQTKKMLGLFDMSYPEFVIRFEKALMTTKYDNIREGLNRVFNEFDVNPNEYNRVERLIGLWNKAKIVSKIYPETTAVLENLRKDGHKLILLSNLPCTQADIIERFKFKEQFDDIFLSYEMGCVKSEGGFEKIFEKTGLSKNEFIMVGDSMESDILSAEKAGIKAILIDRRSTRDYKYKITTLEELKDKIKEVEADE